MLGNVVLRHKIAEGGMGSVWAGEQLALNREVAVKFLTRGPATDERAVERFAFEARLIARMSSPYVPEVFDHAIAPDGTPYIVMELVVGADLRSWVADRGPLDLETTVRLVEQLCLALQAAHQLAVVHRDVKPENILVCTDGPEFRVKLVDFGIAKAPSLSWTRATLTQEGAILGTPGYMSPEQLTGESEVDERSDLWSVGVVAYWALTGTLPFGSNCFAATANAVLCAHFTPPSDLRPELPAELDQWFEKALSRDPQGRFPSAELMSSMLKVATTQPAQWVRLSMPHALPPSDPEARLPSYPSMSSNLPELASAIGSRRPALYAGGAAGLAILLFIVGSTLIDAPTARESGERPVPTLARVAPPLLTAPSQPQATGTDPQPPAVEAAGVAEPAVMDALAVARPAMNTAPPVVAKSPKVEGPKHQPARPATVKAIKPELPPPSAAPVDWQPGEELGEPRGSSIGVDAGSQKAGQAL